MAIKAQSSNQVTKITVKQSRQNLPIELGQSAQHFNNLSELWATSPNIVENKDYSSKYYAEQSKVSANEAEVHERSVIEKYNSFIDVSNQAESEIQALRDDSVAQIKAEAQVGTSDITNNKNNAISDINASKEAAQNSINAKAREELSNIDNLAKSYDNLTQRQITNCILELPQRIKLELNNGTLTLKAGSEVIVPNGFEADGTTPKFDYVTIENDLTYKPTWGNGYKNFAMTFNNGKRLSMCRGDQCYSGGTTPSTTINGYVWYDTTNNVIKRYENGSFVITNDSLFLAEMTGGSDGIASIDQVFNGMGYIGSTFWVDKGVKGLIPDGRNDDGSLKNVEIVFDKLELCNISSAWGTKDNGKIIKSNAFDGEQIFFQNKERFNNLGDYRYKYNQAENFWYFSSDAGATWTQKLVLILADNVDLMSGIISALNFRTVFKAVDYNDFSQLKDDLYNNLIGKPQITLDNNLPSGCVWLEGSTVSRTTYAKLFAIYGTTYGEGDGSTTFVLPDFRNRAIWGASDFGYLSAGLPNIAGAFTTGYLSSGSASGMVSFSGESKTNVAGGGGWNGINTAKVNLNASKSNAIYGKSTTVQPPAIKVRVYAKYQ